jgi:urease beta subunit
MSESVGKIYLGNGDIETFPKRERVTIKVRNTGDRGIQVGAHFHFFEVNRALDFERSKAYGMKLDIPSGTSIRFEPGEEKTVTLVRYGGKEYVHGFNNLVDGSTRTLYRKELSLQKAKSLGFKGCD